MIRRWDMYSNSFEKSKKEKKKKKKGANEEGKLKQIFWSSKEGCQAIFLLFWENVRKKMKYRKMNIRLFYNVGFLFHSCFKKSTLKKKKTVQKVILKTKFRVWLYFGYHSSLVFSYELFQAYIKVQRAM